MTIRISTSGANGSCPSSKPPRSTTICMNSPMYSPVNISPITGVAAQRYTFKNSSVCQAAATCTPVAKIVPAYICPSSPRSQNPFVNIDYPSCIPGLSCIFPKYYAVRATTRPSTAIAAASTAPTSSRTAARTSCAAAAL